MPVRLSLHRPRFAILTACGLTACGGGDPGVLLGPPAELQVIAGADQQGMVGAAVAIAPVVRVTDASGQPIPGVVVQFDVISGGGVVVGDSMATDSDGTVTVGQWLLGPLPGPQELRAQTLGLALQAIIEATARTGPPALIRSVGPATGLSAIAGELILPTPAVVIQDGFGNPLGGENVSFEVTLGGGSVVGGAQRTDTAGRATVGSWRLGSTPGFNRLLARAGNSITATFTATGVEVLGALEAASAQDQDGVTNFSIPIAPRVLVRNSSGQPLEGIAVIFRVTGGDGTLTGDTVATARDGVAALADWRLGAAPTQAIRATIPGLPGQEIEFRATATPRPFTIDVRFVTPVTTRQRDIIIQAALRWMDIIVGDLPDQPLVKAANSCFSNSIHPAIDETVDDLVIFASVRNLDGPGGILGAGGICSPVRAGSGLPIYGVVDFDILDLPFYENSGQFLPLVLHEMGHVLGIGSGWIAKGLIQGAGGPNPVYTGEQGRLVWPRLGLTFDGEIVPVEDSGRTGIRDVHWRESVLGRELMTGFLDPLPVPLSVLTAAAMIDLGYTVNLDAADVFPPAGLRLDGVPEPAGSKRELVEILITPSGRIMPDGRFVANE